MSPRTGRPTDEPKKSRLEMRLSESDTQKLDYCCEILRTSKAEIIRQGIDKMYNEAQNKAKK